MLRIQSGQRRGDVILSLSKRPSLLSNKVFRQAFGLALALHAVALLFVSVVHPGVGERPQSPATVTLADNGLVPAIADTALASQNHPWSPPRTDIPLTTNSPTLSKHSFLPLAVPDTNPLMEPTLHSGLRISGPLAQTELLSRPPPLESSSSQRWVYRVQVNAQTGRVFWMNRLEGTSAADGLVAALRFKPDPHVIIQEGEVHFWSTR